MLTACEPINDPDISKLETMVVHLDDIAYEFKYLHDAVAPIVSRIKSLKDEVLASGFVVAVRGHGGKKAARRDTLGPKRGRPAAAVEVDDAGKAEAAEKAEVEMMAGRALVDAINMTALLRAEVSESTARESELARAKVEVQGGLGQLVSSWAGQHTDVLIPPFKAPLMTKEQLTEAQKKGGKLKAKTAEQLYGWACPGCPDSRGSENSRGRWVLALREDVTTRLGTLFVSRRQRLTIDGHEHRWAPQALLMSQNNERRFQIDESARLKLIRLIVRDTQLSTVGHGAAALVSQGGLLEVDRCEFRTNIARSQGGAIAIEGEAILTSASRVTFSSLLCHCSSLLRHVPPLLGSCCLALWAHVRCTLASHQIRVSLQITRSAAAAPSTLGSTHPAGRRPLQRSASRTATLSTMLRRAAVMQCGMGRARRRLGRRLTIGCS